MANTNFTINGVDIEKNFVTKEYVIDRYAELPNTFKTPTLWACGENSSGQLGDNTTTRRSSPVQTVAGGTNWKQVATKWDHAAAIKTDGTLWTWGYNGTGQLGDNTTVNKSSPIQTVSGGTNWKQVSVGFGFTTAIKTDGTLWAWGYNSFGMLGDGTSTWRSSPVQTVSGGTNWKQVSSSGYGTAAIKTDGTLWVWGEGSYGSLGDNTTANKSSPVQTAAAGNNWRTVSKGPNGGGAIKTDGTLWMWGQNTDFFSGATGQLGDGTIVSKSSPVQTIAGGTNWKSVHCGRLVTAAIKTDGTLWVWGYGSYGEMGDNTTASKSSPVQTVAGGTNWKQVVCTSSYSGGDAILAIKSDGTLWAWGSNSWGQLGTNDTTNRSSPVQTVAGGNNWKQIDSGFNSFVMIRDDSSDIYGDPY